MKKATLFLPHPIFFIMDHDSKVEVPEFSDRSVASATSSCVSVKTIADVDGEVTIKLLGAAPAPSPAGFIRVFEGAITTPGRKISIVTSHNEKILEIDVPEELTTVRVSVNDVDFPEEVIIETI